MTDLDHREFEAFDVDLPIGRYDLVEPSALHFDLFEAIDFLVPIQGQRTIGRPRPIGEEWAWA
jgi:hypothetical protein